MSLKMTFFLQSSALVSPHFFSQHQAAFLGHRWRNSHSFAKIRMSHRWRNSLISPDIHQPNMPHRSELSQDRRQLHHLCPKKDNSDVFPGGFAFCLGITLIDVAYFVGGCREIWGSCAIYVGICSLILALFFAIVCALAICHFATLLGPGKRTPPSPPKKSFFLSLPKETWHLVGSVFRGEPKWKICTALVSPHFFLNIKLPFWGIDGATPTHSPKSGWECPHRWRNSLISPDIHQPT